MSVSVTANSGIRYSCPDSVGMNVSLNWSEGQFRARGCTRVKTGGPMVRKTGSIPARAASFLGGAPGGASLDVIRSLNPGRNLLGGAPMGGPSVTRGIAATPRTGARLGMELGACSLLSGTARAICERTLGLIAGGGSGGGGSTELVAQECPDGSIRIGNRCVAPGDLFPGGDPGTFPAGGQAVIGAFGRPAISPVRESRVYHRCPPGMRLGKDNLCYSPGTLPKRSKFRKWRPPTAPKLTGGDMKALRRAARLKDELKDLAKDAGWKVTKG